MTDKMKDSIRNSMLDELLSDVDKPKPPEPKRSYGGGYGESNYRNQDSFDWGRGDDMPGNFRGDDNGPDPMDDGYNGYRKPTPRTHTGADSVFNRRTHHENVVTAARGGDHAAQVANLLRTVRRVGNQYLLEAGERDELVAIMMKIIGVQLDAIGIVWGTEGLRAFKETLKDLVPMAYYGTTKLALDDGDEPYGELEDGTIYDRATGETFKSVEEFEERMAIMKENGNHE